MQSTELAVQKAPDGFRSIRLNETRDGSIRIAAHTMTSPTDHYGERGGIMEELLVPAEAVSRLVFHLLRYKYTEEDRAIELLRFFCERYNVEHSYDGKPHPAR